MIGFTSRYCRGITRIDLSHTSITTIGAYAFHQCTALTEATFPASLRTIENFAFVGCAGIKRADLSHTMVTALGVFAFLGCTSLTEVIFPDTLVQLGTNCFHDCAAITAADLSATKLATLPEYTFYGCTSLAAMKLPATLTGIGGRSFVSCRALAGVEFPTGLTIIGAYAFCGCTALTDLHIPASVVTVEDRAFEECTTLHTVTMESNEVQFVTSDTGIYHHFSRCTSLAAISVSDPGHAVANWPHNEMFGLGTKQLPELLAAATPDMQLQYYWKRGAEGHAMCLPSARKVVLTVLLVAARLMQPWCTSAHNGDGQAQLQRVGRSGRAQQQRVAPNARQTALPDLPDELWFCILSLIRRHELGVRSNA